VLLGYISIALAAAARLGGAAPGDVMPGGRWGILLVWSSLIVSILFLAVRAAFAGAVYGLAASAWSPVRVVWGSAINLAAAMRAIWIVSSQARPRWDKTAHEFPDDVTV
jgi:hypothetical protein